MSAIFGEILTFGQANDRTRNGNCRSAREYFRIVSTGKLDYSNDVVGSVRLSQNRSFYIAPLSGHVRVRCRRKRVKLTLDLTHTYIGDLIVELTGPGGTKVTPHNRTGEGTDNLAASYDLASLTALAVLVGQDVRGAGARPDPGIPLQTVSHSESRCQS